MLDALVESLERLGRGRRILLETAQGRRLHVVGGALRDVLLGREPRDFDFAVAGSGVEFATEFAARVRGKLVPLSVEDDEARVVRAGRTFDFNGYGEGTIERDLARRDFRINAMACEVLPDGIGELLDPHGGAADVEARVIRPVADDSLARDPLRLLRAFRLALELGFRVDEAVTGQGRAVTFARTAAERIGAEMLRIMEAPGSYDCIVRLWEMGRLAEMMPEFVPVLDDDELRAHMFRTYSKVEELVAGPSFFDRFEPEWTTYFDRWDAEGDGPGLPYRRALLKLSALLHDIAKPQTRFRTTEGDTHFYGHDSLGARVAARMVARELRLSRPQVKMVRAQVQEHMRLHLLATSSELTDRAIRRFFRDLGPEAFGLMMLCYADGWATAGQTSHLEDTITRMIEQKREEESRVRVRRFVTGDDLIAMGLKPGPAFKVILQELEELQVEGRIGSKEEGLEYLRANLPGLTGGGR